MLYEIILAWIPLAAAGISALGGLGGSLISAGGAAAANAANIQSQNMWNQQALNAQMAQHQQNTDFMEDSQAHDIFVRNMGNQWSERMNLQQQDYNTRMFLRNIDEQYKFSNTAYQRAMSDMKAAGLNPILAYQQGGASTPSTGAPSSPGASGGSGSGISASSSGGISPRAATVLNDKEAIGRAMGNFISTAMDVVKGFEDIELVKEKQQTERNYQRNLHVDSAKKVEETFKTNAEIDNAKASNALIKAQTTSAGQHARVAAGEAEQLEKYGSRSAPNTLERMLRSLQDYFSKEGLTMPAPPRGDNSPMIFGKDRR